MLGGAVKHKWVKCHPASMIILNITSERSTSGQDISWKVTYWVQLNISQ